MEKKLAFVSFGGGAGKFYSEDFHLRLDGSNFNDLKRNMKTYWAAWCKETLHPELEIKKFWELNGWDYTEDADMFNAYIYVDNTGWNCCGSAWPSFEKVFEGYRYSDPTEIFIPASVVKHVLEETDDKVLEITLPMWRWKAGKMQEESEGKTFTVELHMVDAYEQLPAKL